MTHIDKILNQIWHRTQCQTRGLLDHVYNQGQDQAQVHVRNEIINQIFDAVHNLVNNQVWNHIHRQVKFWVRT